MIPLDLCTPYVENKDYIFYRRCMDLTWNSLILPDASHICQKVYNVTIVSMHKTYNITDELI